MTAADVARRAGVSRATVSYVLNHAPDKSISPATREAVFEAARELAYRPNAAAQSLKRGRGTTVLLPLPGLPMSHVVAQAVEACAAALTRSGFTLVTDFSTYGSPDDQIEAWLRLSPAAVIDLALADGSPIKRRLETAGVPILSMRERKVAGQSPADDVAIRAREVQVRYLLESGHRRLMLAGPGSPDRRVERRSESTLERAVAAAGGTLSIEIAVFGRAGIEQVVHAWEKATPRPDAICAFNDDFAIALLSAFAVSGVRVPDDVAVIGVDDVPLAAAVTPTLTTVTADFDRFGEVLAEATRSAIDDDRTAIDVDLPEVRVIVRDSA